MNLIPALLLAIPIAAVLITIRVLMVLQNRKTSAKNEEQRTTVTIRNEHKEHTP
jgi:cytochrome c-type biogenesis protein CcmH/NrfF